MHEMEMSSKKPYTKCARVVGEVLDKFDPDKDDKTVYDSLVSMARGYGAFGSIDGHPAAAMRYTECRLDPFAESVLLSDIDQDTVKFLDNYDDSLKEPAVLPARLPTLLLNGAYGMEVGMETSILPHNLGELVDVLCALIRNPEATLEELLEHMPAPDFPTGGIIKRDLGCFVVEKRTRFKLSHAQQRKHIIERKKLTDESSSLRELNHLLSSRANILKLIEQEAMELKDRFSSPRRSVLEVSLIYVFNV